MVKRLMLLFFLILTIPVIAAFNFDEGKIFNFPSDTTTVTDARVDNLIGNCSAGDFILGVADDGNRVCDTPAGGGDITGVEAGTGLIGGGLSGEVTLNVSGDTCGANQVSKYNGTHFECVADQTGAGGGLAGDGTYIYNDSTTMYFNDTLAGTNLSVNSSDYWDSHNSTNSTHFESVNGALTIVVSWFSNLFDSLFGTKTTDDLTEGSTNLYDNQSWNESRGNSLYLPHTTDTNASTECSDGYYLGGDGNCYHFNDSVKTLFSEEQVVYNATSIATVVGTLDSGNLASVNILGDGDTYNVSEVTGAPGFLIYINFSGVIIFNTVAFRGQYIGGAGHTIALEIFRTGVGWEERAEITDQQDWGVTTFPVFIGSDFIDGGVVQLRLNHDDNGISNHDYFLDAVFIGQVPGLVSGGDLADLTGRDNACVLLPDVFCKDGSKNMTGNLSFDSGAGVNYSNILNHPAIVELSTLLGFSYYNSTDFDFNDYYLKSNPFTFWNDTYATFNETYADTLYYGISNPYKFFNTSNTYNCSSGQYVQNMTLNSSGAFGLCSAPILSESDPFFSANLTAHNASWSGGITWDKVINGTMMSQATFDANYTDYNSTSLIQNWSTLYPDTDTWNSTEDIWNVIYNQTFSLINEPFWTANLTAHNSTWNSVFNQTYEDAWQYCTNSTFSLITEPLWSSNYTSLNNTWSSITNTSYLEKAGDTMTGSLNISNANLTLSEDKYICWEAFGDPCFAYMVFNSTDNTTRIV